MVFFQQISLVGFLANLVAIPWVTLVVTPLTLLGILLPWLWWPAAWSVQGLHAVIQAAGEGDFRIHFRDSTGGEKKD